MNEPKNNSQCSVCEAELPSDGLQGLCPKCLLRAGLEGEVGRHLHVRCPHCRQPVEIVDEAPWNEITCPSCDSHFSLIMDSTATFVPDHPPAIGRFKLLDRVGMGAFGSVWKALDPELDRTVAVKIPRKDQLSPEEAEQFLREARAAAQLRHPHIVGVHEVGRDGDRIYLVSDYIEGVTLAEWLTGAQLACREAAELCVQVAEALQHAHERQVVHRDLKPSNIMLDSSGQPLVMDFGLAKRESGEITMTVDGRVLGTPAYMSPEQARGEAHHADARADIYSLGVILFELLTGEKPFRGSSRMLLHQVIHDDPPDPRKLNGRLPRDLQTICLKCLEKQPSGRYQSAAELRDDLCRFLAGRPILARPMTRLQRGWRWCRRNPLVSGLSAAVAGVVLVGLAATLWQWRIAQSNYEDAEQARQDEHQQRQLAEGFASESRQRLVRYYLAEGNRAVEGGDPLRALPWFVQAMTLDQDDADRRATHRLRINTLLNESPRLEHVFFHKGAVHQAAFSPDGKLLATASEDGTVGIWDIETGRSVSQPLIHGRPVTHVVFTADGKQLLTRSGRRQWDGSEFEHVHLWSLATGAEVLTPLKMQRSCEFAQISNDGKRLVTIETDEIHRQYFRSIVRLWDAASGQMILELGRFESSWGQVWAAIGPHSRRVVVALDRTLRVFDAAEGNLLYDSITLDRDVDHLQFNGDGSQFVTAQGVVPRESGAAESELRVWRTDTGEAIAEPLRPRLEVSSIAFSPDSLQLNVVGKSGALWVAEIASGKRADRSRNNGFLPRHTAHWISPDMTLLASEADGAAALASGVRVWNLMTGRPQPFILHHVGAVRQAVFHPQNGRLATCGDDYTVRVWNLALAQPTVPPRDYLYPREYVEWIRLGDDGKRVLVAFDDLGVQLWDLARRRPLSPLRALRGSDVAIAPDCRSLFYVSENKLVQRLDIASGELTDMKTEIGSVDEASPVVHSSPDGRRVLVESEVGGVTKWSISDSRQENATVWLVHDEGAWSAEFSPDGRYVVLVRNARVGRVLLFDATTGAKLWASAADSSSRDIHSETHVLFSPNSRRLILGFNRMPPEGEENPQHIGEIDVLDIQELRLLRPTVNLATWLEQVAFSSDGRLFLTHLDSRHGRWSPSTAPHWSETTVWDVETARPVGRPIRHAGSVTAIFSQDGSLLATRGEGAVRIWDARSGDPRTPPIRIAGAIQEVAFSHDGRWLATAGEQDNRIAVRLWDVRTGESITQPLWPGGDSCEHLAFSLDDRQLLTLIGASWSGEYSCVWDLDAATETTPLHEISQLLSSRRLDDTGAYLPVERAALPELWGSYQSSQYRRAEAGDLQAQGAAWRRQLVNQSTQARHWNAALFHLNWLLDREPDSWKLHLNRAAIRQRDHPYGPVFAPVDWNAVIEDLTSAAQLATDEPICWSLRAEAYTKVKNWEAAAGDFERLYMFTRNAEHARLHALARLAAGQIEQFRDQCRRMRSDHANQSLTVDTLWMCLFRGDAIEDVEVLLSRAEAAYRRNRQNPAQRNVARDYAAALIRSGRADVALPVLEGVAEHWTGTPVPEIWLLLALAHGKLGHDTDAVTWCERARKHLADRSGRIHWTDRVILQSLLRELD